MKRAIKKLVAILLIASMALGLSGCTTFNNFKAAFIDKKTNPEEEKPIIKIGILEPLTGADAAAAADELAGMELAHKLYPSVYGREIELVYADNESDIKLCADAAASLVEQGVSFILGSYKSVLTLASSDIIKEANIPAIAATNTNPIVTQTNKCYFRVCVVDSFEGQGAADYVLNGLKTTNTAIFMIEGNDYASVMANAYKDALEAATGEFGFVKTVVAPKDAADFGPYLEQLAALRADIVYFPESAQKAKPILLKAQEAGYHFDWLGTSRWENLDVEGVKFTLDYDPDEAESEVSIAFKDAYAESKANSNANSLDPSMRTALGFDAYLLALKGILVAGPDAPGSVYIDVLNKVEDMPGATGSITISAGGDPVKDIIVEQYKEGGSKAIYRALPKQTVRSE